MNNKNMNNIDVENIEEKRRKKRTGIVISDCQNKTIIVKVTRRVPHPIYKKICQKTKKYYVHDEKNCAKIGNKVNIIETRPLSKTKRWKLKSIN